MRRTIDRLQAARREDRGFTLIELLIVIIILGILAAIVVFSVRGITDNGDSAACKTEVRTVETAIEAFYANDKVPPKAYPATLAALVPDYLREVPTEYVVAGDYNAATGALSTTCP